MNFKYFGVLMLTLCLVPGCTLDDKKKFFNYDNNTKLVEYNSRKEFFLSGNKVVDYQSKNGINMLLSASHKDDFFRLTPHYSSQNYMSTCGPASLKIILAALYKEINKTPPLDQKHSLQKKANGIDYFLFKMTEENVFDYHKPTSDYDDYNVIIRKKRNSNKSYGSGVGGKEIETIARSHPGIYAKYIVANKTRVDITQGEYKKLVDNKLNCTKDCNVLKDIKNDSRVIQEGIVNFRKHIAEVLDSNSDFIIAYYSHIKTIPGLFSGHFSPIVAFDSKSDMALIMDVASHFQSWYWIKINDLYKTMSLDIGGQDRGYIIISLEDSAIANKLKEYDTAN